MNYALYSSAGTSLVQDLELIWIDEDGDTVVLTLQDGEELACYDESCAPPPHGTGGSKKSSGGGGGSAEKIGSSTKYSPKAGYVGGGSDHERDMALVAGRVEGSQREDGIMTEPWLDDDGNVTLTAKQEATGRAALEKMGTSYEKWVENLTGVAARSVADDPDQALRDSKWYSRENETWGTPLAEKHGVTIDQVMGIASATSTNKQWEGVKSNNKEVAERILDLLKEDLTITITAEQSQQYAEFSEKGRTTNSGGGKYGAGELKPGDYKMSELSSGTLARVMSSGYQIGGQYYTDGLVKAFAIARGEIAPEAAIGSLKQRSFVNNLTRPNTDYSSTNDFWMARAMFGQDKLNITKEGVNGVMTIKEFEAQTGKQSNVFFGTKGAGTGNLFAMATKAAKEAKDVLAGQDPRFRDMLTHEFQALVWVQMQREWDNYG